MTPSALHAQAARIIVHPDNALLLRSALLEHITALPPETVADIMADVFMEMISSGRMDGEAGEIISNAIGRAAHMAGRA